MRSETIQSLQAYRAIAAILVVLFHITKYSQEELQFTFLGNIFAFGYTGVDFFFVLSGFIIFYVHGRDLGNPTQILPYLKKRFIRIYPIYWLVTSVKVMVILLAPSIAKIHEREPLVVIKSYLLIPQINLPVIGAAWTLSYELLFYGLFMLGIWLGGRRALWLFVVWGLAVLVFTVSRIAGLPMLPQGLLAQFVLNEHNLEFLFGCLSAYLVLRYKPKWPGVIVALGAVLFVLAAAYVDQGGRVLSYTLMFGLPSFLLVLGTAFVETRKKWRIPKALVFLGNASYSLYLTHALFVAAFMLIWERFGLLRLLGPSFTTLGMVVAAITGSSFLYQFIERPLLDFLRKKMLKSRPVDVSVTLPLPNQHA